MDFISKHDVFEMAKSSKVSEAADGVFFLVFWEDNQFGVVSRNDLVNIAVSELTEKVYGQKCEAMYGSEKYYATLIFFSEPEESLSMMQSASNSAFYDQPHHNVTNPLPNTSNDKNHVNSDLQPSTSCCMSTALRALQFVGNDNNEENVDIQDETINILNEECQGCINKTLKIEVLSGALEKARVDHEALLNRIRYMEEKTGRLSQLQWIRFAHICMGRKLQCE
ncbi:unnamed protein product [Mytilus coruscus]|uniref:Uncharacterized protein n=1 Tax=Mytilus coruscus TaxID=42192 RepID=A0A6J8EUN1_MYTCO|nr:unnamed protein product [Mytilus coruscus]